MGLIEGGVWDGGEVHGMKGGTWDGKRLMGWREFMGRRGS